MNSHLTKSGERYVVRTPSENDAEKIISFAKILFASTDQVLTTPEEYTITIDEEKSWINSYSNNPNAIILIAERNDEVIGLLDFTNKPKKKMAHTGELGISVHPEWQGKGIGTSLMETLMEWAKKNKQVEKVFLNVFASNEKAIALYRRLGFLEEGRQRKAIKQPSGEYVDLIQMYVDVISSG